MGVGRGGNNFKESQPRKLPCEYCHVPGQVVCPEKPRTRPGPIKPHKAPSTYGGEIAQGPIHILPIWDTTWALTCINTHGHVIWNQFNFPMLNPH